MNNLAKIRKEFHLTQKDLANILETTSNNIGYYELEKRDFSTKLLIKISEYFKVSIDFILATTDKGIKVYYDGDEIKEYLIDEEHLNYYLSKDVIYYRDASNKRYISIHRLLGLDGWINLTNLMNQIYDLDELNDIFKTIPLSSRDDLDKLYCLTRIKQLDLEKIHVIKKLFEML